MKDSFVVRLISIVLSVIVTSFYFFTFNFRYFAGANTKTVLAGIALPLLLLQMAKGRKMGVSKDIVVFTTYSLCVSLTCLVATIYNNTTDYTYVTYVVSMWVWMAAAYVVVLSLERLNGRVTFETLSNYLIIVCVAQCVIAVLISRFPVVKGVVGMIMPGIDGLEKMADGRLYGIGCAFDVAGIRFACVLVLIIRMIIDQFKKKEVNKKLVYGYWIAFFVIVVIGNMIARTTTVGALIGLAYLICTSIFSKGTEGVGALKSLFVALAISIPLAAYLYQHDEMFREDFRFGFEGFVSLVEKGTWEVSSNDILVTMYRFPETLKTWLIGDGYILTANDDPYYLGEQHPGYYYMGTDVGYLRFIYYAGLPLLLSFLLFLCYVTRICCQKYDKDVLMFLFILLVQIVVWFKVATDIFMFFALFVAYGKLEYAQDIEDSPQMIENNEE